MEEKTIISHTYTFLEGDSFRCACGSEVGAVHILKYSDGSEVKECNSCFLFDKAAEKAGLLDNPDSFVPQGGNEAKKPEPKPSHTQTFGYILYNYSF